MPVDTTKAGDMTGKCPVCKRQRNDIMPQANKCRECYNAYSNNIKIAKGTANEVSRLSYIKMQKRTIDTFNAWTSLLRKLNINTLTESEWLECCSHFEGCALCGSESIDARGFFIAYKDGGKYNRCNVIPLCEHCANELKRDLNPFKYLTIYKKRIKRNRRKNLRNIIEYLEEKINDTNTTV